LLLSFMALAFLSTHKILNFYSSFNISSEIKGINKQYYQID